ncbi:MAG: CmcI family methyltransferase [Phycisphaerae bacterium]|nr:CmcI family methyltransferase [Phycisphaerae bacterium]
MKWKDMLPLLSEKGVIDRFHKLYYNAHSGTWRNTFWFGVACQKCPLDLWIYQELVFELKPDRIVECGTADGGTSLFLAHMCDLANAGRVLTIDIEEQPNRPAHERVTYLCGSDTSDAVVGQVEKFVEDAASVMVILDSDHSKEHVSRQLSLYSRFVTPGGYFIVEDSNIGGHPVRPKAGAGPMEAIQEFLATTDKFLVDRDREKFYLTFNPSGFLKRIK